MPIFHGTLDTPTGAVVATRFSLIRADAAALRRAGNPVPPPADILALTDTGAEVTCITPGVARRLGAVPTVIALANVPAAGGFGPTVRYELDFALPHPSDPAVPPLDIPILEVLQVDLTGFGCEAVLGRDVLASCVLIYDGTAGAYTLSY